MTLVLAVFCDLIHSGLPGQNSDWFLEQLHRGAIPPLGWVQPPRIFFRHASTFPCRNERSPALWQIMYGHDPFWPITKTMGMMYEPSEWKTYMLSWMEYCAALSDDDVSGYNVLICGGGGQLEVVVRTIPNQPENFLTPSRLPGDPPWLWTVPPARFVAARTAPVIV